MQKKQKLFLTNMLVVLACLCLLFIAFFMLINKPEPTTVDNYMQQYGGKQEVYSQILNSTNCTELQGMFDTAYQNSLIQDPGTPQYKWSTGYMTASNQKMKSLNCYVQ